MTFQICLDLFGCVQMHLDAVWMPFGCLPMHPDRFGKFSEILMTIANAHHNASGTMHGRNIATELN